MQADQPMTPAAKALGANLKLPTMLAVPILLAATYFGHYYVWGFLFVFWAAIAVRSGDAFLIEPVPRRENPILFWFISLMWFGFGVWYVVNDLLYRF